MSARLADRSAFVTAAGQGIGRAVALAFAADGARVIATDRAADGLATLADELGADATGSIATHVLDATDSGAVARLAAEVGPVDVLYNGVGWVADGSVLDCDPDDWRRSFEINVDPMFHAIRAFLPGMLERGRGSIVNMASVASSVKGVPNRCAYGTTKAAVVGLTRSVAADYVTRGVRCNAICPGTVQSPSLDGRIAELAAKQGVDEDAARAAFVARQPIGRLGTTAEIAALCVYLASDESAYTTGAVHVIDGGWSS
ncbi:2-keto-3-deoxy-L-fuconate dehydrogenase [Planctomycetes bacterium Pla163]|uniref:2-keto-3-deoxy-L-fuconate dehydrogenase n=1 Tax=Rohdeia mirabilis TaxID=2528008 RepID=A0A518D3Z3_9BACT|nr:2-keto-3-deoxy-L-fuconate dehydrogenase [Planctomycetes bacterium Pla163]